jgi:beta-lactamase regulating signal transducer with metallopeptidase domain
MLLSVFERYFFLQSLGWGIANSLWQAALLWMLYQIVTGTAKNLSPLFKHHLSLLLLLASFLWFVNTTVQNYLLASTPLHSTRAMGWLHVSTSVTVALQWLSLAYIAVLGLYGWRFVQRLTGLQTLRKSTFIKAPVVTRLFTTQTAIHIGIRKKVTVWLSEKVDVPSVIGFLKPMILLPVSALNHLSTEQAEAIILHELAHIKRNDYIVNLLQSIVELFLFFNPFARLLGSTARKERENCCDDWVLNYQYNKHDYASALLSLEQHRSTAVQLALAATNGKKNLLGRVKRLFVAEPQTSIDAGQRFKLAFAALGIVLAIFWALPLIGNKTAATAQQPTKKPAVSPLFAAASVPIATYTEISRQTVVSDKTLPTSIVHAKKALPAKRPAVKNIPEEVEYNFALVNEELLQTERQLKEIAIQTADKGVEIAGSIVVKIEEEQSGVKDKNTYLLELKNNNGNPEIKPLIILNKKVRALNEKLKSASKAAAADSLKTALKKRITS